MKTGNTIHSMMQTISLAEFEDNLDIYIEKHFAEQERIELQQRPEQSIAGILAVKQALVSLCKSLDTQHTFTEKSFVISHKPDGAPVISQLPPCFAGNHQYTKEEFSISISHNRNNAYGLAAVQERHND